MLVVVLVLLAGAALVAGLVTGVSALLWVALAVSVAGLVVAAAAVYRRTRSRAPEVVSGTDGSSESAGESTDDPVEPAPAPAPEAVEGPDGDDDTAPAVPPVEPAVAPVDGERSVVVVPGRRRFHAAGCRLLAGAPAGDEVLLEEAVAEGFSACTTCHPRSSEALAAPRSN